MPADPKALQAELGHTFRDQSLLLRALTHKSRAYENGAADCQDDNEQLEFLGDSILGFLVSEWLVAEFPAFPEGRLSKLKAHLVSASHLHNVAKDLRLGEYLLLGRGEELSGGREKKAILANAIEALIAALYLDGGIEPVRTFVTERVLAEFHLNSDQSNNLVDFKSALQEMAQSLKLPQPRYAIVSERGPEHAKTFVVEVRVGREWASQAEGLSKKSAGQKAAELVLQQLVRSANSESGEPS
jgi:ribonuclease-3